MKTLINNIRPSIMGTIQFDGKFLGMRQEQKFLVYPIAKDGSAKKILCQSSNRWLEIDAETGKCDITSSQSGHHSSWMLHFQKMHGKQKEFTLPNIDLQALKMAIFTTAGKEVGGPVKTDNSGAYNIL